MYHLALILNKEFLVNEWDQAGGLPWQCAAVQVYVEVLGKVGTKFLTARDAPIAGEEETDALHGHNG